jgi:hypothetical protein
MVFAIVILLLVGVIAYFHWVQGLFSGVISATVAAIAAVLAVSYHEPLAALLLQGKLSDQAYAITLVSLFVIIYLVGRVIFDNFVPGNIRLPALVDKIGGGVTGFIAGMFALGIVAIAAQSLPFGPSIGQYSRYTLKDSREVQLPQSGKQAADMFVNDEMKTDEEIDPDKSEEGMILPVDDFVIGAVRQFSDGGALEGDRPLKTIHPAYLNELFFQRAGVQAGAKHVALNTAKLKSADLVKAYALDSVDQVEGEMKEIRPPRKATLKTLTSGAPTSGAGRQLIVVRIKFGEDATDDDHLVRFSGGSVRLVAEGKNYLPVGTLHGDLLVANKPDDFLVAKTEQPVDFVFFVDRETVLRKAGGGDDKKAATFEFKKGTFVEIKRMVRLELSGPLEAGVSEPVTGVIRKAGVISAEKDAAAKKPKAAASPAPAPAPAKSVGGIADGVGGVRAAEEEAAGGGKKKDKDGAGAKPDTPN